MAHNNLLGNAAIDFSLPFELLGRELSFEASLNEELVLGFIDEAKL